MYKGVGNFKSGGGGKVSGVQLTIMACTVAHESEPSCKECAPHVFSQNFIPTLQMKWLYFLLQQTRGGEVRPAEIMQLWHNWKQ